MDRLKNFVKFLYATSFRCIYIYISAGLGKDSTSVSTVDSRTLHDFWYDRINYARSYLLTTYQEIRLLHYLPLLFGVATVLQDFASWLPAFVALCVLLSLGNGM